MIREFIITKEFDRMWKLIGLNDNDLSSLEIYLCKNPKVGVVMEGTGELRKLRWALDGKGKSGGARIIYFDIDFSKHIYLLTVFPKNLKENLSKEERNQMKNLVTAIRNAEKEVTHGRN